MRDSNTQCNITMRTARGEEDFWLVRGFLLEIWGEMPPAFCWEVRRWDGSYFHDTKPGFKDSWGGADGVGLWFDADRLVAVVHPEDGGDTWLEVRRDYRWLEPQLLDWAEQNLARPDKAGQNRTWVLAWDYDSERQALLASRGYVNTGKGEVFRERPYPNEPIAPVALPDGYMLHEVRPGNQQDAECYAALLNDGFRRDFHQAAEIVHFTENSPSFRSEIELVAVAPDGRFAALTGMIYDEVNRFGLFEPVCATRGPRPIGLTGLLMQEGWRRVRELGALTCHVGTGIGMAANRFYDACGFKVINTGYYWKKVIG